MNELVSMIMSKLNYWVYIALMMVGLYAIIAKKTGTSATTVGKQRAAQIRSSAPKGTLVQQTNGSWGKR